MTSKGADPRPNGGTPLAGRWAEHRKDTRRYNRWLYDDRKIGGDDTRRLQRPRETKEELRETKNCGRPRELRTLRRLERHERIAEEIGETERIAVERIALDYSKRRFMRKLRESTDLEIWTRTRDETGPKVEEERRVLNHRGVRVSGGSLHLG